MEIKGIEARKKHDLGKRLKDVLLCTVKFIVTDSLFYKMQVSYYFDHVHIQTHTKSFHFITSGGILMA